MIYITGDTHAEFNRFSTSNFPEQKQMTREDYVIVLGDFGGIWYDNNTERYWLKWLSEKNFTLLFIDGNHSNFDRLNTEFPIIDFHEGKAHKIRDNIYHLMRGYVFNIEDKKFFAFGGASSHDIQDGILDIKDYLSERDLINDYRVRTNRGQMLRINHLSWWKEELPSQEEMKRGKKNLMDNNYDVDYVISHCPPKDVCNYCGFFNTDSLIHYFDELSESGLKFKEWWSGHLHKEILCIFGKYNIIYNKIVRIV